MDNIFFLLLLLSLVGFTVGLISPVALSKLIKRQLSRGTALKLFGAMTVASFIGFGVFVPDVPKPVSEAPTAIVQNATSTNQVAIAPSTNATTDTPVPTSTSDASSTVTSIELADETITNPSPTSTALAAPSGSASESGSTSTYLVLKVVDGDTFDLQIDGKTERIRMIGVDTPETVDPRKAVQCFGKEASDKMKQLIQGKRLSIETEASQGERDKYGRLLAYAFLEDGTNVGLSLIKQGYAHEYTYAKPYKYQGSFKAAELAAKTAKVGLWADDACAGDTTQPAAAKGTTTNAQGTATPSPTPATPSQVSEGIVKKSTTNICHDSSSSYYERTKNFIPFDTIEACLASGGRLPKR